MVVSKTRSEEMQLVVAAALNVLGFATADLYRRRGGANLFITFVILYGLALLFVFMVSILFVGGLPYFALIGLNNYRSERLLDDPEWSERAGKSRYIVEAKFDSSDGRHWVVQGVFGKKKVKKIKKYYEYREDAFYSLKKFKDDDVPKIKIIDRRIGGTIELEGLPNLEENFIGYCFGLVPAVVAVRWANSHIWEWLSNP